MSEKELKIQKLKEKVRALSECLWDRKEEKENWGIRKRNWESRFLEKQRRGCKENSRISFFKKRNKWIWGIRNWVRNCKRRKRRVFRESWEKNKRKGIDHFFSW